VRRRARVALALLTAACARAASDADTSRPATTTDTTALHAAQARSPRDTAMPAPSVPDSTTPVEVIRRYYADIASKDYTAAYALWGHGGRASGKSEAEFARGFATTRSVTVTIGDSTRIEGAAGSEYATIPVTVDAETSRGERQHFVGTYTLRRVMVDGAPAEDRRWHIESVHLSS
jgi:hypothetical protein